MRSGIWLRRRNFLLLITIALIERRTNKGVRYCSVYVALGKFPQMGFFSLSLRAAFFFLHCFNFVTLSLLYCSDIVCFPFKLHSIVFILILTSILGRIFRQHDSPAR